MKRIATILSVLAVLGVFAAGFIAVSRAQDIIDWWRLRDYTPSAEVVALADKSSMNDLARKLFYVHDPALLNREAFQQSCTVGEKTIVLGCYVSNQRIFIYDIQDKRLEGIEEVTAAHEMLHAAYDRLSLSEKEAIHPLLQEAYDRNEDERFRRTIASYRERDESVVLNELHSILGTEIMLLPKELEEYYKRYFNDRRAVVRLAVAYAGEFEARERKIESYDKQLTKLNGEIVRREADLKLAGEALSRERDRIERLRSDPEAFNSAVNTYNNQVNDYNAEIARVRTLIDSYNTIVKQRNKIAVEERELVDAIDTRVEEL